MKRTKPAAVAGSELNPSNGLSIPDYRLAIEYWPLSRLAPYARNPRKNDAAVGKMVRSIQEYGFSVPLLAASASGELIDGHLRLKAGVKLGMAEFPVIPCDNWTADQIRGFRLMVNRSVAWAEWDDDLLRAEMVDLKVSGFDLTLTGFDARQIDGFTLTTPADADTVATPPKDPASIAGDLWVLGDHRLLCGSCLDPDAVKRLLDGRKPTLLVTDPPYGIELDMERRDRAGFNELGPAERSFMKKEPAKRGKRKEGWTDAGGKSGDTMADWSPAFALIPTLQIAYVWHATRYTREVQTGLERIGFDVRQMIIWRKTVAVMSRQAYMWIHEPCWYAVRKGKSASWVGEMNQTTVWDAAPPKHIMSGSKEERFDHPTQKPIDLMRRSIVNHGAKGDDVYEPFGGSGTTLAACELTARRNCSMEIDPRYIDVIVDRWQRQTGRAAILEGDGRTFPEISAARAAAAGV